MKNIFSTMSMEEKNKRAPRNFILEAMFSGTAQGISNDLSATLMAYFGFSVSLSSALGTIVSCLGILDMLGAILYVKVKRPMRYLRLVCTSWRVFLPFMYFAALLPMKYGVPVMAAAYLLSNACIKLQTSTQLSWMTGTLEGKVKNNYYLWKSTIWLAVYTVTAMVVNFFVDKAQATGKMGLCLPVVGAFFTVLLLCSLLFTFRLPAPEVREAKKADLPLIEMFRQTFTNPSCRRILLLFLIATFFNVFNGFCGLYRIQVLKVSLFQISIWATVGYALRVASSPLVAKLANRFGWVKITSLGYGILGASSLLWFLMNDATQWILFPIASILTVMPYTILDAGPTNITVLAVPTEQRSIYFSVKSLLEWGVALLGSTILTATIKVLESNDVALLRYIFLVGSIGMVICIFLIFRLDRYFNKQKETALTE